MALQVVLTAAAIWLFTGYVWPYIYYAGYQRCPPP
jgi:hypothetical protein